MFVEVVGGILSGSLALLADAGHMLTDAAAILLALFAMWIAERPASVESTFGYYRTEVLAALFNTLSLWVIAAWIFFEAYHRIRETPEVEGPLLLGVGAAGLVVNILAAYVLHRAAGESLNAEGAFQHVMADLFGSIGVVVSGVLILAFATSPGSPWFIVDPILSIGIGLLILRSSWGLFMRVFKVLIEGTPKHLDMYRICSDMEDVSRRDHHPRRARLDDHLRLRRHDRPRAGGLRPTRQRGRHARPAARDRLRLRHRPRHPAVGVLRHGL